MKKVSLITIFDNVNFGTYLQTVALATLLKNRNCDVEVVLYVRKYLWFTSRFKAIVDFTKNPLRIANRTRHLLKFILNRRRDWNFVRQYVPLTSRFNTFEELQKNPPQADIYMTGSDQVWNSKHNQGLDKSFYLDYAPAGKIKMAYSASIGMKDFQDFEREAVASMLSKYKHITVRESGAKDILNRLGLGNVEVTLDPTLMLNLKRWNELMPFEAFKKKERYLLIYSVEKRSQNDIIEYVAKKVARERGLKIYSISNWVSEASFSDKVFNNATPQMFISLMRQADFTVVSSFHGTAYSINFNKQFITIAPSQFSSRIDSLLQICGLTGRKIYRADSELPSEEINYSQVNVLLDKQREFSNACLDRMLI